MAPIDFFTRSRSLALVKARNQIKSAHENATFFSRATKQPNRGVLMRNEEKVRSL